MHGVVSRRRVLCTIADPAPGTPAHLHLRRRRRHQAGRDRADDRQGPQRLPPSRRPGAPGPPHVRGGWKLSGDLCRPDGDGHVRFEARSDDAILAGGRNVSGLEVGAVLPGHAKVRECEVAGSPDADRGAIVKAFAVPAGGADGAAVAELQDFEKSKIAPFKHPRAIGFVETLPLAATGKIRRRALRALERGRAGARSSEGRPRADRCRSRSRTSGKPAARSRQMAPVAPPRGPRRMRTALRRGCTPAPCYTAPAQKSPGHCASGFTPGAASGAAGRPRDEDDLRVITGRKPDSHLTDLQHPRRRFRGGAELPDVRIHDLGHSLPAGPWPRARDCR